MQKAVALVGAVMVVSACESAASASLDTDEQKASYAIGRDMGNYLKPSQGRLDMDAFVRGVEDALAGSEAALPDEELQGALQRFSQAIEQDQQREREEQAGKNTEAGEAYLAENAAREGVQTTASGLQYEVLAEGAGPRPTAEDRVTIHYKGTLIDGTEFDSSYGRGQPATFGVSGVIPGFSEGLQLMPVGSKYRFVIPGDLAYGPQGTGDKIGPDATLVFEVELLEIQ